MYNRTPKSRTSLFVGPPEKAGAIARLETAKQDSSVEFFLHLPEIAWIVDIDGHLVNANAAFFRTFRLDPARSVNQLLISLIPAEISASLSIHHRNVFHTGQVFKSDLLVTQPNDTSLIYQVQLFPLPHSGGRKILGGMASIARPSAEPRCTRPDPVMHKMPSVEIINKALQAERARIGHELHDNVNQILGSAALYIDSLKPVNDHQSLIRTKGREYILLAIEEIRNLSRKMVMPCLDHKTLSEKIRGLINDIRATTSLQMCYNPGFQAEEIGSGKKLTLFRIIQEQVKNILTHSKASEAAISIDRVGNQLQLVITDNGIGFDPQRIEGGVGLASMMKRVTQHGGKLQVDAGPGHGCRLTATIPVDEA